MRELQDREPIGKALGQCFVMVGLNPDNYPHGLTRDVLINFIVDCYGGLTHEEIVIAFHLALTGKLAIADTNCYQNFSCEYLGKIMAAYYKWRMKEMSKPQRSADLPAPEMNDEQWFITMLIEPYERLLKGDKYSWSLFQEVLLFNRLCEIGFRFYLTPEESNEIDVEAKMNTVKPKGLMSKDKKNEYQKDVERTKKALCFRKKIQEKAMENFDLRVQVLSQLQKFKSSK